MLVEAYLGDVGVDQPDPKVPVPRCEDKKSDSDNCSTGLLQKFQG